MGRKHVCAVANQRLDARFGDLAEHVRVKRLAHTRGFVQLEIAGMDDPARACVDDQCRAFRYRMADRGKTDFERSDLAHVWPGRNNVDRAFVQRMFVEFQRRDVGGKGAGIDGGLQARPQMGQRADVIFVRMGDEYRIQPVAAVFQPADVGQDQIDAGGGVHVREGHTQINEDQAFFVTRAIPVDICVHADLARPAERQIDQPVIAQSSGPCCGRGSPLTRASSDHPQAYQTSVRSAQRAAPDRRCQ